MTTVMPQGELVRKAVTYISDEREESEKSLTTLIEDAAMRFNLSPKECDFLTKFFTENDAKQG